jgi:hypothetical protein
VEPLGEGIDPDFEADLHSLQGPRGKVARSICRIPSRSAGSGNGLFQSEAKLRDNPRRPNLRFQEVERLPHLRRVDLALFALDRRGFENGERPKDGHYQNASLGCIFNCLYSLVQVGLRRSDLQH